ncbi:MAG: DUF5069 domain-containing protein [Candidatus Synoicihabitans palmerolidicus]|nr:DUF5069 domain-containing protein [Candidatus Synoicihabitans palmerolidicus]
MINYIAPDLTQHPPRSPRLRLGGFVHLPRLLDKARAFVAGLHGDYIYPCPMDKRFLGFVGIDPEVFLSAVRESKSDTEMLTWVLDSAVPTRAPYEILAWSDWLEKSAPGDVRRHANFASEIERLAPARTDVVTTFDRMELDDYTSFGGRG